MALDGWQTRLSAEQQKQMDQVLGAFSEHADLDDLEFGLQQCGFTPQEAEHYVNCVTGDASWD